MKTEKIDIGCNIYDVDVKTMTAAALKELKDQLFRNRIIIIKNQEVNEQQYVDFAMRFGTPVPYLQSNYHHPDYPLIFVSSNVKQDGKQIGVPRTGGYWHSDTSFEEEPKTLTMLLPRVLPKTVKRTTRFIDMSEVYKALPASLRDEIENENFIHSGRWRYKVRKEDAGLDITEILEMIDYYQPPVEHPAVITHPHTREKIVYGSRGFTIGVSHKGLDDSARILQEIFDLAESPRFVKEITWSMGDLIIWDNRYLLHSSGRSKAPTENIYEEVKKEEETMMYRITLKDAYPLFANPVKEREPSAMMR